MAEKDGQQEATEADWLDAISKLRQEPIFEIFDGDKHYKIYINGRVEGFDSTVQVINQIPFLNVYWEGVVGARTRRLKQSLSPANTSEASVTLAGTATSRAD